MVFAAAGGCTRVRNVAKVSVQFWLQLHRTSTMSSSSTTTTAAEGMEGAISQDGNRGIEEEVVDDQGRALTGVTEGSATVYFPPDSPEEVFYNPGRLI